MLHLSMIVPGTRLGPYEIVSPLGAGGMGEVFRARDTRIGRDVAVKILPASFAADDDRLRRFEQEAQVVGALNHPNLVTIYDLGTHEGAPYLVMELIEGETLRQLLSADEWAGRSRLPVRKAIDYAIQLATGLASAHEKGIVHRDLKPENILITRDGRVKILDFGLARITQAGSGGSGTHGSETLQRGITSPGTVLGTVGYMSPEQVRGQDLDHRSDIFSFGAILYEMLAGERAFKGGSSADVMSSILKEDVADVHRTVPGAPPALDQLIQHCLEKDREQRFQSARDLAFDLKTLSGLSASSPSVAPLHSRQWPKPLLWSAALGAALLIAAAGYLAGRASAKPESRTAMKLTPLTYEGGEERQPAIAPDGNSFLYVSNRAGNLDIYLRRIGGETAINLTADSEGDDFDPAYSPDGKQIAFRSNRMGGGIFVMGATGESVRRVTDFGFRPAWSPDGKELVVQDVQVSDPTVRPRESRLWRVDAVTGARKPIEAGTDAVDARWSPDGTRIAFWGLPAGTGKRVIYTVAAGGGTPVALTDDDHFNWNPIWSPDGRFLYFSTNRNGTTNIWRIAVDPKSGKARSEPEPVTASAHANSSVSVSSDGRKLLFVAGATSMSIDRVDLRSITTRSNVVARTLHSDSRRLHYLDCSADGEWLVFRAGLAPEDLFVIRTDGTALRRLTDDPFKNRVPQWSGDGQFVYFMSDRTGRYEIWRIRSDGSALEQMTVTSGESVGDPRLSPDGKKLAVVVYGQREGRRGALVNLELPLERRKIQMLPLADGFAFTPEAWSPDSSRIAGTLTRPDGQRIGMAIWNGAEPYQRLKTADVARSLRFSGSGLFWAADGSLSYTDGGKLIRMEPGTMRTSEILTIPADTITYAASRDGRTLYLLREQTQSDIWMAESESR
ncbi:MAG TPA: protein kinase [Thermoanaerobaculia bacterium]|nr:protein kinase [Thermoanaerobaculia bacterium]